MKDRKKLGLLWVLLCCSLFFFFFSGFTLSNLRLHFQGFQPRLRLSTWHPLAMEAISGHSSASTPPISIQQTIIFPDQVLLFLKYPPSTPLFTKNDIDCVYLVHNSSEPHLTVSPLWIDDQYFDHQIVRCPLQTRGMIVSIAVKSTTTLVPVPTYRWEDKLAYEAVLDRDNTTVVFVKGLNLRSGRVADPSKFKCIYSWDLRKPKFVLRSNVVSAAQEIVRCKTPLSILNSQQGFGINTNDSIKVSVRVVGRQTIKSVARLKHRLDPAPLPKRRHKMCICTMLRNQAKFLHEWVMYHGHIGVERWFIYDNNSDDDIEDVIKTLLSKNYDITRHVWPWIKTQESGFSHCALGARDLCEWIGFIDVDEFFHLPSRLSLHDVIEKKSRGSVGELRVPCHNFGPSGLKKVPVKGVTVGYTCRLSGSERHKSIVRPEKLNSTLINLVHHFHLKAGFRSVNVNGNMLVINHYKYQVWEVFKEKFYRRVAAYVSDWQHERNVGSKDRAPGLGTKAIEPPDWSTRFCEVRDTGLRDWVLLTFTDDKTGRLPWQG